MRSTIIEWDGKNIPEGLRRFPPGVCCLESVEGIPNLEDVNLEEDAGIRLVLDRLETGQGVRSEEVTQWVRSSTRAKTVANGKARSTPDHEWLQVVQIDWDGTKLPKNVLPLPPGLYLLTSVDDDTRMSEEEELGVMQALDEMEAGQVFDYDEVMRDLRSRYTTDASRPHPHSQG